MKPIRFLLVLVLGYVSVSFSVARAAPAQDAVAAELFQQHARNVLLERSIEATALGLGDAELGVRIDDRMDDYSVSQMRTWRRMLRKMRRELARLSPAQVDPVTVAALESIYDVYLGASEIPFGYIDGAGRHRPYIINQFEQPLQLVPQTIVNFQKAGTPEQAGDYLRRMWAFSPLVNSVLGKFTTDADAGWIPPRPLLEGALDFLDAFSQPPAVDHALVTALMQQVNASDTFTAGQRARIENEAVLIMETVIYPSYANAIKVINERLPEARSEAGIWSQPLGEMFYRHSLRHEAGTAASAAEIHALGLAEVKRIQIEMDGLLRARGYGDGSVAQRMKQLADEEGLYYPDSDEGRQEVLKDINTRVQAMQVLLAQWFGRLPRQGLEVRRVPLAQEKTSGFAYYNSPPATGDQPGIFWINLGDMQDLSRLTLPTTIYHEAVPGHHLESSLALDHRQRPLLWRIAGNTAYSEGWGLYAEQLAAEMGVYQNDPVGNLGRLQDELFRAARLVVDTGLHYERWSRDQAVKYLQETTGRSKARVIAEVQRYMAIPGQALSYKLGMLDLLALRAAVSQKQGANFQLRDFHDLVLTEGPLPMSLLGERVRASLRQR